MNKSFLLLVCWIIATTAFTQSYQSAESVEYDASQNRWIVANGNNMLQIAEDGTISFFGTGSGSHGTEVMGDNVYTLDGGTSLKAYNLATEELVFTYTIPGSGFLNGLTNDGNGILYATDFSNENILKIDVSDPVNVQHEVLIPNTGATPNGILYEADNNRLLWVTWGSNASVRAVDLSDNSMSTLATTSFGNFDGIIRYANGEYLVSSWSPSQIIRFNDDFTETPEVFPTPSISNPADIGYSLFQGKLAIPVGSNVVFAEVVVVNSTLEIVKESQFSLFPNPSKDSLTLTINLPVAQDLTITVYDMTGQLVLTRQEENLNSGTQQISLKVSDLDEGSYVCKVVGKSYRSSGSVMIKK